MGPFFTDLGPDSGLVLYRDVEGSIEVFGDPDHSRPIGQASCIGWDAAGSALWRLVVHDEELEGPWVIVEGEFLSTGTDRGDLYDSALHPEAGMRRRRASQPFARRRAGPPRAPGPAPPGLPSMIP